jgi:glyoxylase-like metal-dependent hydrolase (beta-lactamase superfamily II)
MPSAFPIVHLTVRSTNYWALGAGPSRLLVDLGWPGLSGALCAELERKNIPVSEIRYGFATHYHMDHAGAAQDFKNRGMTLIVTPEQVPAIEPMKQWMKPEFRYTPILSDGNAVVRLVESRAYLRSIGVAGELVHTPGHSDDSVSLLLDSGEAFTGDLTAPGFATEEDAATVAASWQALRDRGARTVYAGHGPIRPMPR